MTRSVLHFLTLLIATFYLGQTSAQQYEIKLSLSDVTETEVYLANYFGSKLYYADTAQVNKKGIAIFKGDQALKGGKYAFVTPGPKLFEVLIDDDQQFEMSSDTTDFIGNVSIKGSAANELYYGYIKLLIQYTCLIR